MKPIFRFLTKRFREPSTRVAIGASVAVFLPDHADAALTTYDAVVQAIGAGLMISAAFGNDRAADLVNQREDEAGR